MKISMYINWYDVIGYLVILGWLGFERSKLWIKNQAGKKSRG